MGLSGWRSWTAALLVLGWLAGCAMPSAASPPLTAAAAKNTLDSWNPNYCQVVEFYGFLKTGEGTSSQMAYALIANPGDKAQKPQVYTAQFHLLSLPDGQQRWFLVSLLTPSSGLSKRQGWDNLFVPVQEAGAATGSKAASGK